MFSNSRSIRAFILLPSIFALTGCEQWVVMNPSGDVAVQEAFLIEISTYLMLIVIVPVIFLTFWYAWKYRAANRDADYDPNWNHSATLETIIWTAPLAIILVLSGITYVATHRLDPYKPIRQISPGVPVPANAETLIIEVVAMDWKWLFLYPEEGIATINEVAAPLDRPIQFKITSGTVMNSFYIPALAGQIYAMAGMETKMHAVINEPGVFDGFSANYSGHGFSQMRFKFHGLTEQGFDRWVRTVRTSNLGTLDTHTYKQLETKTVGHPVTYYSNVEDTLYYRILNLCVDTATSCNDVLMMHGGAHGSHLSEKP